MSAAAVSDARRSYALTILAASTMESVASASAAAQPFSEVAADNSMDIDTAAAASSRGRPRRSAGQLLGGSGDSAGQAVRSQHASRAAAAPPPPAAAAAAVVAVAAAAVPPLHGAAGSSSSSSGEAQPSRAIKLTHTAEALVCAGLKNEGNTCYINAVLQCLLRCPPLLNHLYDQGYHRGDYHNPFVGLFDMALGNDYTIAADATEAACIKNTDYFLLGLPAEFTRGDQHDAHEFLAYLLNSANSALLQEAGLNPRDPTLTTVVHDIFGCRMSTLSQCYTVQY
jgi:Ubiquitin carboxyl-terminal hydrolase